MNQEKTSIEPDLSAEYSSSFLGFFKLPVLRQEGLSCFFFIKLITNEIKHVLPYSAS